MPNIRRNSAFPLVLLLVACADNAIVAPPPGAPRAAFASTGRAPLLRSNAVKYRDQGQNPVSASSRTGMLTARALVGRDGSTSLELTTAPTFESDATPTAGMKQVTVTRMADGDALWEQRYNLDGATYASYAYPDLIRGSQLAVRTHVHGNAAVPGAENEIVSLTVTAYLRPDLAVGAVQVPARVTVGAPTSITATVSERNGDVGARADCLLYVDGEPADRSRGIWVDAGDAVSCRFVQHFMSPGARHLEVRVANVAPADYDVANNSATRDVDVVWPNAFTYSASADVFADTSSGETFLHVETPPYLALAVREADVTMLIQVLDQSMHLTATMPGEIAPIDDFSLAVRIGGQTVASMRAADGAWPYSYQRGAVRYDCVLQGWDDEELRLGGRELGICTFQGTADDGSRVSGTSVDFTTAGSATIYLSRGWEQSFHDPSEDGADYADNIGGYELYRVTASIPYNAYGTDIAIDFALTSGGATYRTDPRLRLAQMGGFSRNWDRTCTNGMSGDYPFTRCYGPGWERSTTLHAETSGVPDPLP